MSKNLLVKITKRTSQGVESWEGTANLPGVQPTKLTKANGSESKFSSRTALTNAAERLASRYGFEEVKFEGATNDKKKTKKKVAKPAATEETVLA